MASGGLPWVVSTGTISTVFHLWKKNFADFYQKSLITIKAGIQSQKFQKVFHSPKGYIFQKAFNVPRMLPLEVLWHCDIFLKVPKNQRFSTFENLQAFGFLFFKIREP